MIIQSITPTKYRNIIKNLAIKSMILKWPCSKKLNLSETDKYYFYYFDDFATNYFPGVTLEEVFGIVKKQPKIEYRYFCFRYLNYMRQYQIPVLSKNNIKEAVLIEFRCFIHCEFLLRNAIHKLGNTWNYTVVCGVTNMDMMKKICKEISPNIKIIVYPYKDLDGNSYSMLLSRKDFWETFVGDKILIYQEDSCIFKNNIEEFLQYDYIGAPWPLDQNDNTKCVGMEV